MAQAKQHTSCVFSVQHFQIMYIFLFLSKLTMASLREKDVSWTFNSPGLSLINFSLPLIQSSVFKLSFDFRTPQVNGALLHITLQNSDMLIITEETRKLLYGFNMFLELRQGYVKLIHTYDHYVDVLTIIKAINPDTWHKTTLNYNQANGKIGIGMDEDLVNKISKAYSLGNAKDMLDFTKFSINLQYGGSMHLHDNDHDFFIGCLRNMRYSTGGDVFSFVPVLNMSDVSKGCTNKCSLQFQTKCENRGRCVNYYSHFHCDCFGTDFEGENCNIAGVSTLTLSGYDWVVYKIYAENEDCSFSRNNRFALEFKTEHPSSILLYAAGRTPHYNHVVAILYSGVLHVSMAFDNDELTFQIGIGLDNNRWHNLTIVHEWNTVEVYLDNGITRKILNDQTDVFFCFDPLIYIGGGNNFVSTTSLPVTQNFAGCMKNVYYNEQSVLYNLRIGNAITVYHGGEKPTFHCSPVRNIPISFPTAGSLLRWNLGRLDETLFVEFNIRSVRQNAILFYVELITHRDVFSGWEYGYMEIWIIESHLMLMFVPSVLNSAYSSNITLPITVNDNKWHSVFIQLKDSQAKLRVDSMSMSTAQYRKPLNHKGQIIFGFGLRRYSVTTSFVGCMEKIFIQGEHLDPLSVVESNSSIGLKLDGCFLIDHCSINNICEHDSKCMSDWNGVHCDCMGGYYIGKACHFANCPATCDSYYQAGHRESGVYLVDVDGSGPLSPNYVYCLMGLVRNAHQYGVTSIDHNFENSTLVRDEHFSDRRYELNYRGMNSLQLMALTQSSFFCEQFIKYTCLDAPILLGKRTWFLAANGQMMDYFGGSGPGFCSCLDSTDGTCDGERCYCDHHGESTYDEGFIHTKYRLPITEMIFLQNHSSTGHANMTLGPLLCWGNAYQLLSNMITFLTETSYLDLHTWTHGDFGMHFRTYDQDVFLLVQTSNDTVHSNRFFLRIVSAYSVEFNFYINGNEIRETVVTLKPITDGGWHSVMIEHDAYNLRLSLDTTHRIVLFPDNIIYVLDFNGILYLGGLPSVIRKNITEGSRGFSGCVRSLFYNDNTVDLTNMHGQSMNGMAKGCMSSCWPNPCKHGGSCVEQWGNYRCVCLDPWAHHGSDCEHNLNADTATFSGESDSFLTFDLSDYNNPLDDTIVLSFRTFQMDAILFYAYDHLSNFIMMELQKGRAIVLTFNILHSIVSGALTVSGNLSDGEWKQVVAMEYYNMTKLIHQEQSHIIQHKHIRLQHYDPSPFSQSVQPEIVFRTRPLEAPEQFARLFVGGVGDGTTLLPFLMGCVRGMHLWGQHLRLAEAIGKAPNTTGVLATCVSGCSSVSCLNGGHCMEKWGEGGFLCDCSSSEHYGARCEKETSVMFRGSSIVEHTFQLPLSSQHTAAGQLMLSFRTQRVITHDPVEKLSDMALALIKSTETNDYVLAKIDLNGDVLIEANQGVGIYRFKVSGNFSNGEQHQLVYRRDESKLYLTMDNMHDASIVYPYYHLDKIDTVIVGGVLMSDLDLFMDVANFTGCISDVVFVPEANNGQKIRSLKSLFLNASGVVVHGDSVEQCTVYNVQCTVDAAVRKVSAGPRSTLRTNHSQRTMMTMPTWDVKSARIVTLSPPYALAPPFVDTTPNNSVIFEIVLEEGSPDFVNVLVVVIVVSLTAGILVVILTCALLMLQKQRPPLMMKGQDEMELCQPLKHCQQTALSQETLGAAVRLARLDEFSCISATLGPRTSTFGRYPPSVPDGVHSSDIRVNIHALTPTDESFFSHPIYIGRKQRPASSISEVLEELERLRLHAISPGSIDDNSGQTRVDYDVKLKVDGDPTPLSYMDITFPNTSLLEPISKAPVTTKASDHTNDNSLKAPVEHRMMKGNIK